VRLSDQENASYPLAVDEPCSISLTSHFNTWVILHDILKKGTIISSEAYVTALQRLKSHKHQIQSEKKIEDALLMHTKA
jgi:hypothetical protein